MGIICIVSLLIGSASNSSVVTAKGTLTSYQRKMADRIAKVAIEHYDEYKILPSLVVTQACQESSLGVHCPGNNLWGIQSGKEHYSSVEAGAIRYMEILNYKRYKNVRGNKNFYSSIQNILDAGYCEGNPNYVSECEFLYETYDFSEYDQKLFKKLQKDKERRAKIRKAKKRKEAQKKRETYVSTVSWTMKYDPSVPAHCVRISKKYAKKGTLLLYEDYCMIGIYDTEAVGNSDELVIYTSDKSMDGHVVEVQSEEGAKG